VFYWWGECERGAALAADSRCERWFSFQPSELAKLALVIALAYYGERYQRRIAGVQGRAGDAGAMVGTVLAPDFSGAGLGDHVLLGAVSAIMLLVAGVRWLHLVPVGVAGLAGLGILLIHDPTRWRRVRVGWIWRRARHCGRLSDLAIDFGVLGSGGWTGVGLGEGCRSTGTCRCTRAISYFR
jgi:cell division protein FtsW